MVVLGGWGIVLKMAEKVLQADKIVYEQQLGWNWKEPDPCLFERHSQSGQRQSVRTTTLIDSAAADGGNGGNGEAAAVVGAAGAAAADIAGSTSDTTRVPPVEGERPRIDNGRHVHGVATKKIMELLCDEAG